MIRRDADLLLDLLVQHRDRLRHLQPDNEGTRRVQNLVEERRKLVEEKTAQINRLIGYWKIYFPQMLQWFARLDTRLVCEFLERWPSLEELKKVPPAELRKFFGQGHAGIMNSPKIASKASSKPCLPFRTER
jgi:transposase